MKTLFTSTDERFHSKLRRAVSNAYAMTSLVQFEPLVDSTTTEFLKQLKQRYADKADEAGVVDFGAWLQYYAFDDLRVDIHETYGVCGPWTGCRKHHIQP